jgi:predicted glycosyltransferase
LPFVRPALGVAPESLRDPALTKEFRYGLRTYEGLKEDVYAAAFDPDPEILNTLGIAASEILVTIRPPATEAHYHNPEAENLFVETVNFLGSIEGLRMVILPRTTSTQGRLIQQTWSKWCGERRIIIPDRPLAGLNLVWFSDLVVSGGGTMNREAAALGVPVYSIFRGKLGAVDRQLAREGRLVLIEKLEDVRLKLNPVKRVRDATPMAGERRALRQILEATYELLERSNGHAQ